MHKGIQFCKCWQQCAGYGRHHQCRRSRPYTALTTIPITNCCRACISVQIHHCGMAHCTTPDFLMDSNRKLKTICWTLWWRRSKWISQTVFTLNKVQWSFCCGSNFLCCEEQIDQLLLIVTSKSSHRCLELSDKLHIGIFCASNYRYFIFRIIDVYQLANYFAIPLKFNICVFDCTN